MELAKRICTEYYELGVYLGIEVHTIKAKRANNYNDIVQCAFEILTTWRRWIGRLDSLATFNVLCRALADLKRTDLVELVSRGE